MPEANACGDGSPWYDIRTASADGRAIRTSSGLRLTPDAALRELTGAPDLLIVPGGPGALRPDPAVTDWLRDHARTARRLASVCTGAFLLAEAGLLSGHRVTTHWALCAELAARYPDITVDPEPIFISDGRLATSAGVTAGIDLALALVEDDLGRAVALAVARDLVVFLRRPGSQAQFSAQLSAQVADRAPLREVRRRRANRPRLRLRHTGGDAPRLPPSAGDQPCRIPPPFSSSGPIRAAAYGPSSRPTTGSPTHRRPASRPAARRAAKTHQEVTLRSKRRADGRYCHRESHMDDGVGGPGVSRHITTPATQRRPLAMKRIRLLTAVVAALCFVALPAVSAAASATASTFGSAPAAMAGSGPHICETHNYPNRCVGSNSLALYASVRQQNPGRDTAVDCVNGGPTNLHLTCIIYFTATANNCAAASVTNAHQVDIKHCSGTNGILWFLKSNSSGNSIEFVNKYWYNNGGHYWYLEGDGVLGDRFHVYNKGTSVHYNFWCAGACLVRESGSSPVPFP